MIVKAFDNPEGYLMVCNEITPACLMDYWNWLD